MLFKAVSCRPNQVKSLIELLYANADTVFFKIDKNAMHFIHNIDDVYVKAELSAAGFQTYEFNDDHPVYVGLGQHTARDFKSVKKGSTVNFKLTGSEPILFEVIVGPHNHGGGSVTFTTAVETFRTDFSYVPPVTYKHYFQFTNSDFSAMCRGFKPGIMTIEGLSGKHLTMSMCVEGFKTKKYILGEEVSVKDFDFHFELPSDRILKLSKMSAFANKKSGVRVHIEHAKPIMFRAECESGFIEVYITT
ncbi:hypothetical protein [Scale drop disease virus]|uniref:ORF_039L n=1 Tax=Scale drop disease virus TaxID=1697349 RepID=A0A0K1L6G1_9VIRU|nr:ORF_039L [Scale drop disease virus]AKU37454.1 ORF_039L [Scale drop disease virus]QLI60712.1 hypothetical protein [Scale drop disease virus]QXJ13630.1 ORF039L [Scale drop disease virus]UNH60743.1 proliferating cell nuclear antigen [Scale drop disease virus]